MRVRHYLQLCFSYIVELFIKIMLVILILSFVFILVPIAAVAWLIEEIGKKL